jgi:L-threonylcarbamoyladenylate synthase
MKVNCSIDEGLTLIKQGNIIAYPTEAVFGLGCCPFNEIAVKQLLALKKRPIEKGLILLISDWGQLPPLIQANTALSQLKSTWPGHVTWLLPKSNDIPQWICGTHQTVAIRMTNHPIASALCKNGPIVSTSANISDTPPATSRQQIIAQFPLGISAIVEGNIGPYQNPSDIYDYATGQKLR